MEIVELLAESELREAFPVMQQLRPHLDEHRFLELLRVIMPQGYRVLAVRDAGRIVAVAGIKVTTTLHLDRHVWVYDLVPPQKTHVRMVTAARCCHMWRMSPAARAATLWR